MNQNQLKLSFWDKPAKLCLSDYICAYPAKKWALTHMQKGTKWLISRDVEWNMAGRAEQKKGEEMWCMGVRQIGTRQCHGWGSKGSFSAPKTWRKMWKWNEHGGNNVEFMTPRQLSWGWKRLNDGHHESGEIIHLNVRTRDKRVFEWKPCVDMTTGMYWYKLFSHLFCNLRFG